MKIAIKLNNVLLKNEFVLMLRAILIETIANFSGMVNECLIEGSSGSITKEMRDQLWRALQTLEGYDISFDDRAPNDYLGNTSPIHVNGVLLSEEVARLITNCVIGEVSSEAAGMRNKATGSQASLNAIAALLIPDYREFPRFPEFPNLQAVDKEGYEYRDMQQSDLSKIHMDPPPADDGWRRETLEMLGATGRMVRKIKQEN